MKMPRGMHSSYAKVCTFSFREEVNFFRGTLNIDRRKRRRSRAASRRSLSFHSTRRQSDVVTVSQRCDCSCAVVNTFFRRHCFHTDTSAGHTVTVTTPPTRGRQASTMRLLFVAGGSSPAPRALLPPRPRAVAARASLRQMNRRSKPRAAAEVL